MAQRRRNRGRGNGNGNGNGQQRSTRRRNPPQQVSRPLYNPATAHVQGWFKMDVTAIKVPLNQTVHTVTYQVKESTVPGIADFVARYQMVTVHSLGFRVNPMYRTAHGMHCVLVQTKQISELYTLPATTSRNHMWMLNNGSKVYPVTSTAHAPPSNNVSALRVPEKIPERSTTGTVLGSVYWAYEGPPFPADMDKFVELEVYIDAIFAGL